MNLILNRAQAEAVYSAMCALNNVGGLTDTTFGSSEDGIRVYESKHGRGFVWVTRMSRNAVLETEKHSDQTAFATAYGLSMGA